MQSVNFLLLFFLVGQLPSFGVKNTLAVNQYQFNVSVAEKLHALIQASCKNRSSLFTGIQYVVPGR